MVNGEDFSAGTAPDTWSAFCGTGRQGLSGGVRQTGGAGDLIIHESYPTPDPGDPARSGDGWSVTVSTSEAGVTASVWVVCAGVR